MQKQKIKDRRTFYPLISAAVKSFLTDCHIRHLSPRTIDFYNEKLTRFITFCETQSVTSIDKVDAHLLRTFFLWLENKGNSAGSRHAYYRSLRALFRWLENEFEEFTSPLRKVKPPKVNTQPIEGVSIADVQALLKTCRSKTFCDYRDKAIMLVLLDTGVRASELLALNWSDVDLILGSVFIRKGKNGKPRTAFIGRTARQALRAYARLCQDGQTAVWVTVFGERITYDGLRDILRRRSRLAGISPPSPHDFRRTCALTLLRNGADVISVSRLLGHSSLEVTKVYLAQTDADLEQAHRLYSPVETLKRTR
ncbi:MAG: tyrosine-type recombinase/integrase [Anaerolineae bacterium]|nr:tyrosine-type recombinase/integrase [Anaerolineae bacterium]